MVLVYFVYNSQNMLIDFTSRSLNSLNFKRHPSIFNNNIGMITKTIGGRSSLSKPMINQFFFQFVKITGKNMSPGRGRKNLKVRNWVHSNVNLNNFIKNF